MVPSSKTFKYDQIVSSYQKCVQIDNNSKMEFLDKDNWSLSDDDREMANKHPGNTVIL